MKVACIGYRKWALNIYKEIMTLKEHSFLLIKSEESFDETKIINFSPDLILFYGWSRKISNNITKNFKCLMLHPSPLPLFRGGSPIQNQIIRGIKDSKVSIFLISEEIDAGDIFCQEYLDLRGSVNDIFLRIENVGIKLTKDILKNKFTPKPQVESQATYFKRRLPNESELTIKELQEKPAEYLYNKIRMLGDPYPNAFIRTVDGKAIKIKSAELEDETNEFL